MKVDDFLTWFPIGLAALALLIAGISLYLSIRGFKFSKADFEADRTTIIATSMRFPGDPKEFGITEGIDEKEKHEKLSQMFRYGLRNAILAFVPSLKPNSIRECRLVFPKETTEKNEFTIGNISAGSITRAWIEHRIIDEGDFAVPLRAVTDRLWDFFRRITPERHKVQYGTLNDVTIPLVIELILVAKGQKFKERQLYELQISYQVSDKDECFVHHFTIDFQRRLKKREKALTILTKGMRDVKTRFNEPLPVEDVV